MSRTVLPSMAYAGGGGGMKMASPKKSFHSRGDAKSFCTEPREPLISNCTCGLAASYAACIGDSLAGVSSSEAVRYAAKALACDSSSALKMAMAYSSSSNCVPTRKESTAMGGLERRPLDARPSLPTCIDMTRSEKR